MSSARSTTPCWRPTCAGLGVEVGLCERTLTARLPAIPEAVCEAFSHRSQNGTAAARAFAAEAGLDWDSLDAERKIALLKSGTQNHKLPKDFALTPEGQAFGRAARRDDLADFAAWAAQATRIGFRHETVITATPAEPEADAAERAKAGVVGGAAGAGARAGRAGGGQGRRCADRRGTRPDRLRRGRDGGRGPGAGAAGQPGRAAAGALDRGAGAGRDRQPAGPPHDRAAPRPGGGGDPAGPGGGAGPALRAHAGDAAGGHGRAGLQHRDRPQQKRAIGKVGVGGAVSLFIGVGGSGKTTRVLPPLVTAYRQEGREVWGIAQAWEQANRLAEAGIDPLRTFALKPFLDGLREGSDRPLSIRRGAVVIVDEFSQIGTRELLDLLRAQQRHDFKLDPDRRRAAVPEHRGRADHHAAGRGAGPARDPRDPHHHAAGDGAGAADRRAVPRRAGDGPAERLCRGHPCNRDEARGRHRRAGPRRPGGGHPARGRGFMAACGRAANDPDYTGDGLGADQRRRARDQPGDPGAAARGRPGRAGSLSVAGAMDGAGRTYDDGLAPGDRIRLYRRTHARFRDARGSSAAPSPATTAPC